MGVGDAWGMWGQAPCTTDLSEEVCVIAASTESAAQCPSNVISIYLDTALTTPANPLLCFISMWTAVGGAVLLRRPKSMWNSAPALGLWGQWSSGISVEMARTWGHLLPFSPWDRVRDTARKGEDKTCEIWPSRRGREYLGYTNPGMVGHHQAWLTPESA